MKLYESLGNRMLIQFSLFLIMKFKWPDWFYWKSEHIMLWKSYETKFFQM